MPDQSAAILGDYRERKWDAKPFERMLELARERPAELEALVRLAFRELPQGVTFLEAALSYVEPVAYPGLIEEALKELRREPQELAAIVIAYASMQFPQMLHPQLEELFDLAPNAEAYYANWPWRESGARSLPFLLRMLEESGHAERAEKAFLCMLETRHPEVLKRAREAAFGLDLPQPLPLYFAEVGCAPEEDGFRLLYSEACYHLQFAPEYLHDPSEPVWLQPHHPTWNLPSNGAPELEFGGAGEGECLRCGGRLHRLLLLDPVLEGVGVTGRKRLDLCTCLSCLGWEAPELFYRHDGAGRPAELGSPETRTPDFSVGPLQPTRVRLVETPDRWRWQDWALSNSRENLHRLGGYPCWVQSAQYPECSGCGQTMAFLMQLDSNLRTADGGEWLWGSGGIGYACWCDRCKISAWLWQCT